MSGMNFDQDLDGLVYNGQEILKNDRHLRYLDHFELGPDEFRNQLEWIDYWKAKGMMLAAAPEIYQLIECLSLIKGKYETAKSEEIESGLFNMIYGEGLVTATSTEYGLNNGQMTLIWRNRRDWKPIEQFEGKVFKARELPDDEEMPLDKAARIPEWETYLKDIFYTANSVSEIAENIEKVLGSSPEETSVHCGRADTMPSAKRVVSFVENKLSEELRIGNLGLNDFRGYSIGVRK